MVTRSPPTLGYGEEIGKANWSDIYELLKEAYKPEEFSKKQLRMLDKVRL